MQKIRAISLVLTTALKAMDDETTDYSDIPSLTEEFFEKATLRIPSSQAHRLV
ncbi:MAG: hypothetical protein AB4372_33260 [Xenococcus sp. (in: cyanobacteria)]